MRCWVGCDIGDVLAAARLALSDLFPRPVRIDPDRRPRRHHRAPPLLTLSSPEKRCGKTTLLTLLGALSRRPLTASNITPAALFRAVERWTPTLLIDEADSFIRDADELRGVINSGHTRAAAYVIRTIGDDHEPASFSTWWAKAIALIGSLPDMLVDRSIVIPMRRRTRDETIEGLRLDKLGRYADIPRRCMRWATDNGAAVGAADPELPARLSDRAAEAAARLLPSLRRHKPELLRLLAAAPSNRDGHDIQHAEALDADAREYFDERAAIIEYDGGMPRPEAEHRATRRVFEYRLADQPGRWLTVLGALDWASVDDARAALARQFGTERVVDVRRYRPANRD